MLEYVRIKILMHIQIYISLLREITKKGQKKLAKAVKSSREFFVWSFEHKGKGMTDIGTCALIILTLI